MRATLTLTALALLVAASAYMALSPNTATPRPRVAPAAASTDADGADVPTAQHGNRAHRAAAEATRYRLRYRQRFMFGGEPIEVGVDAEWIVSADGNQVRLEAPVIKGRLPVHAEQLTVPMHMKRGAAGVEQVAFEGEVEGLSRRLLVALGTATSHTPGAGSTWSVIEQDRTGRYAAEYTREGRELVRRRTSYLALRGADGQLHSQRLEDYSVEGEARFGYDAHGLARLRLDETTRVAQTQTRPAAESRVRIELDRIGTEPGADAIAVNFEPLKRPKNPKATQRRFDEKAVGDATVNGLLDDLKDVTLEALKGPDRDRHLKGMSRLAAALRLNPDQASAVAEAARAHGHAPAATSLLTGALRGAGTPESADALEDLLNGEVDSATRVQAASGLGLHAAADAETLDALDAQLDDETLGAAAELALGSAARTAAATDAEAAEAAVDTLLEEYQNAESRAEKRRALQAIANSGDPRGLPIITEALAAHDPELAPIAAYAIRFIVGAEADALLVKILAEPQLPTVWQGAVRAIAYRDIEAWRSPLGTALSAGKHDATTLKMMEALLARDT